MHLKFAVGHVAPKFELPPDFIHLTHSNNSQFELFKFSDLASIGSNILSEYYWLFSLKRTLYSIGEIPNTITIMQYRRFVINKPDIGRKFKNVPYSKYLNSEDIGSMNLNDFLYPSNGNWLLNEVINLLPHNITSQYAESHYLRDFLRFCADSVDTNLITDEFASYVLTRDKIIAAPTIGTFAGYDYIKILDFLENLAVNFFKNGFIKRSNYQERSIAYILERFHSAILLLNADRWRAEFGFHTVHSDTDIYSINPNGNHSEKA